VSCGSGSDMHWEKRAIKLKLTETTVGCSFSPPVGSLGSSITLSP